MSLICWSGGCDSTLILLQALRDGGNVRTLSLNYDQVGAYEESWYARQSILKILRAQNYQISHTEVNVSCKGDSEFIRSENGGVIQPIMWISMATSFLQTNEDLYMGYIQGDCIWHYKHEFVSAFDQMQQVQDKTGKLQFPLEWMHKDEIIGQLDQTGMLQHVWYCELPLNHKPCGDCASCKTHNKHMTFRKSDINIKCLSGLGHKDIPKKDDALEKVVKFVDPIESKVCVKRAAKKRVR
jgi:7-cyano-7-deazaguanine synthase in queuosine biosynthesis